MLTRLKDILTDFFRQADLVLLALCCVATLYGMALIASASSYMGMAKVLRYVGVQGAALLLGLVCCNLILKPLCARIRPYDLMELKGTVINLIINKPHDFSFPSGHTAASFEAATVIFLHNKKLGIPALILASLIAFSRLYLYVHYPTDVIFGLILGVALGFLGKFLVGKGCSLYEAKKAAK